MRALLLSALAALTFPAQAAVYKWVDPATGSTVYSDQPHRGARQLDLPPAQTYSAPDVPQDDGDAGPDQSQPAAAYKKFAFISPQDQETVRNTGGVVNVSLALEPDLRVKQGDRISLIMDDQREYGPATNRIFSVQGVVRGTHTLQAVIKDAQGQVVAKTPKITIYYKQHSILHRKPNIPP